MIDLDVESVKLKSLANLPTVVSGIAIQPVSLKRIIEVGYDVYQRYLSVIMVPKDKLVHQEFLNSMPQEIGVYDIIEMFGETEEIHSLFYSGLKFIVGSQNIHYTDSLFIDDIKVNNDLFSEILDIIKVQNCISNSDVDDFKPANERVKKLREKQLENRRKIQELKKNSGDDSNALTFFDLVSILSSNANGLNIFNVFDMNIFQFNDQFNRMKLLNDYEISIQSILHGADPNKVEIKHWMSKA